MAARSDLRMVPEAPDMGFLGRAARAFAYVLLVVTCTVVAALGGYQVGIRSTPDAVAPTGPSTQEAVQKAVAAQKAEDRKLRRAALAKAMAWQRAKLEGEFATKADQIRLAEAEAAARAYRRGKQAGKVAATRELAAKVNPAAVPPAPEDAAAAAAEDGAPAPVTDPVAP